MITSSCLGLNVCFAGVPLTSLNHGQRIAHFESWNWPVIMHICSICEYYKYVLWTVIYCVYCLVANCIYYEDVANFARTLKIHLCLMNCIWKCSTDNMKTWTKLTNGFDLAFWTAVIWCPTMAALTLSYKRIYTALFGNNLYSLSVSVSLSPVITATSKTNYTILLLLGLFSSSLQ